MSIASPEDGASVPATFPVTMEAEGIAIEATAGAAHFHLLVDAACLPAGEQIPADDTHIHLADGATETELTLAAGDHGLCLQVGDGKHAALDLTHEITVTVAGEVGETTTQAEERESVEDWEGTYAGEVVWDCGAAGTHRGTLEADVLILTYGGGRATLDAEHMVTGSCADTGTPDVWAPRRGRADGLRLPVPFRSLGDPGVVHTSGERRSSRGPAQRPRSGAGDDDDPL